MKLYDTEIRLAPDKTDIIYKCPECDREYYMETDDDHNAHLQYNSETDTYFVYCYGCQHYNDIDDHTDPTPIRIQENYIEALRPTSWLATKAAELRLNAVNPAAFSFI